MKKVLILIIFNLATYSAVFSQVKHESRNIDSVTINAIILNDIDYRFKILIKDHLSSKLNFTFLSKGKYLIAVFIYNLHVNCDSNKIIDSGNFLTNFINNDFDPSYRILIYTIKKSEPNINAIDGYSKYFLYNYKSYDILFITNLNIDFNNKMDTIELRYEFKTNNRKEPWASEHIVYELSTYEIRKISSKRLFFMSSDVSFSGKKKGVYWSNRKNPDFKL